MASLFDGTDGMDEIEKIYNQMEANYRGSPCSESGELWLLQWERNISDQQSVSKTMLDKAVALLAKEGHMPGWFNRCPVASGITDPSKDKNYRVDLVHWYEWCRCARLIELQWKNKDPYAALKKILRYGAAYLFCRVHKTELPLCNRPLMNVCHVSLEVVAPQSFCQDLIRRITKPHGEFIDNGFVDSKISGLSMSLNVLAFPDGFQMPFSDGADVKRNCNLAPLPPKGKGQAICKAFNNLTPVWP